MSFFIHTEYKHNEKKGNIINQHLQMIMTMMMTMMMINYNTKKHFKYRMCALLTWTSSFKALFWYIYHLTLLCRLDMTLVEPYNLTATMMFFAEDLNQDGVMSVNEIDAIFDKYDANGTSSGNKRPPTYI